MSPGKRTNYVTAGRCLSRLFLLILALVALATVILHSNYGDVKKYQSYSFLWIGGAAGKHLSQLAPSKDGNESLSLLQQMVLHESNGSKLQGGQYDVSDPFSMVSLIFHICLIK